MDSATNLEQPTSAIPAPAAWEAGYGAIDPALEEVERRLRQQLQSRYEHLAPILRHGALLGGKRMRPALVLLAAEATGTIGEDHLTVATVLEMVHTATLVHDDVLDSAQFRRHVPTVNAKWDEQTSILLGDYLFAQSFYLAATLGDTRACRWIGEAARRVCEGELRQVHSRNVLDLDEAAYLSIVQGKTAELCSVACRLGAAYSGADQRTIDGLSHYGDALGIAFQIADDYLDLWGDSGQTGKTLGTDVYQGKMTLPLIRLLHSADQSLQAQVLEILRGPAEQRLERIMPLLAASDARQYTRQRAEQFVETALAAIAPLPASPAKQTLHKLARFAIERRF
ncbi:polyprenyl synthetase family protein [Roseimaritima sediminicola]|uniref:polyprenyl synthetase family protein n=1 Tax=Roseimaritima sediminicola TaxID=2662066 RepID=UPI00129857A7|nr:polyprenyl synthetase family protein [Roseimaritima sediminicola]